MKMEKLTTGAVVPAGGDVVREGINQGLAWDDLRYESKVKGAHGWTNLAQGDFSIFTKMLW
jgi:hypothetical protein